VPVVAAGECLSGRVRRVMRQQLTALHKMLLDTVRRDPVCQRLMTVPGVGPVVALTYRASVDQPHRFLHSRAVGDHAGLTPRRHQSGEIDYDGTVSKCGDTMPLRSGPVDAHPQQEMVMVESLGDASGVAPGHTPRINGSALAGKCPHGDDGWCEFVMSADPAVLAARALERLNHATLLTPS
jgi:hypothetical protein